MSGLIITRIINMQQPRYKLHQKVWLLGSEWERMISEISIQPTKVEYKLWTMWTTDYHWFDEWQVTDKAPDKIWFKT